MNELNNEDVSTTPTSGVPLKRLVRHLEKYSISTEPLSGVCKSPAFWGHYKEDKSGISPLVYFKKPKWISDESFAEIVKHLSLDLPEGHKIVGSV